MKPSLSNQELTWSPWTPITTEPAFSSLYGRSGPGYKTLPRPHRLRRLPFPPQTPPQTPFASQTPHAPLLTRPWEFCWRATAQ